MQDLSYLEALMGEPVGEEGYRDIWGLASAVEGRLSDLSLQTVGKARGLADGLGAYVRFLLAGAPDEETAQTLIAHGADYVYLAPGQADAETLAAFLRERKPEIVLLDDSITNRALAARVAQALDASLVTEAEDVRADPIDRALLVTRPIYEGIASQVIACLAKPQIVTVRAGAFPLPYPDRSRTGSIEQLSASWQPDAVQYEPAPEVASPPALTTARIVVSAGRGMEDAEGFALVQQLAARLGAAIAGDRGALDMGWIGPEQQVGALGVIVTPALYIACGIEGTTEHYLGMEGARAVIALCRESDAPLLKAADWGIIGSPKEIVRALVEAMG
ncbi:MAG: electron transfer flavoprotein subunit alpha/FixB family protein [Anaerolineae bacterium]|nr:electron transfer flavoprotein subunit alpha/FixB family protein [Anaerolineae bacterium]